MRQTLFFIGSDFQHLKTPTQPVRLGPPKGPAAVKTRLSWTHQGTTTVSATPSLSAKLHYNVERLWQLDILTYQSKKLVMRSWQAQSTMELLQAKTVWVNINEIHRYATPLLKVWFKPTLSALPTAVLANLRSTEKRLLCVPMLLSMPKPYSTPSWVFQFQVFGLCLLWSFQFFSVEQQVEGNQFFEMLFMQLIFLWWLCVQKF